jgi:hypothetical protein
MAIFGDSMRPPKASTICREILSPRPEWRPNFSLGRGVFGVKAVENILKIGGRNTGAFITDRQLQSVAIGQVNQGDGDGTLRRTKGHRIAQQVMQNLQQAAFDTLNNTGFFRPASSFRAERGHVG